MSKKLDLFIPSRASLEKTFSYIRNDILKINLVIAFRYIIFLIALENEFKLPGAISYSLYKNIILHIAAIVESSIHYCLKECIDCDEIKKSEVMSYEWKNTVCNKLYKISKEEEVCGIVRHKKIETFSNKTQFKTLNEIALKAKIFNKTLFDKSEDLRSERNKIHLAALTKIDDFYDKKDIQKAFDTAKSVTEKIEDKLKELRS